MHFASVPFSPASRLSETSFRFSSHPNSDAHSPLTPLPPLENVRRHEVIRFGFSPLTVNRLLEQGTTPTVLKTKPTVPSPSPRLATKTAASGGGGAVRKVYSVPQNTPSAPPSFVHKMHPTPTQQKTQQQHRMQHFDRLPMMDLLRVDMLGAAAAVVRSITPPSSRVRPAAAAKEDDKAALTKGIWEAIDVRPRLDSMALVQRMLRNNQLGHLGGLFKSEEIDLEVLLVMSSDDLREIGLEKLDLLRMIRMCSLLRQIYKV